jgi:hypothetical protein
MDANESYNPEILGSPTPLTYSPNIPEFPAIYLLHAISLTHMHCNTLNNPLSHPIVIYLDPQVATLLWEIKGQGND